MTEEPAVFTFTTLPNPGFPGSTDASDINAAGQIVGSYQDAIGKTHGYLLSGGVFTTIDDPLTTAGTVATGINDMVQVVGWYFHSDASGSGSHGFLYSNGVYTTLDDPLAGPTSAYGINNTGQIVGDSARGGFLAVPNRQGAYSYNTIADPLATQGTSARGINNAGQIVGYYYTGDPFQGPRVAHGFLYNPNDGTYTTLDDPFASSVNGGGTQAFGINDLGQIVGTYRDSGLNYHGFLYTVGTFITLDNPLGQTLAYGMNSSQVVGIYVPATPFVTTIGPNLPPPEGTTAVMILRHGADGLYGIYDIGNNSILVAYQLGKLELIGSSPGSATSMALTAATCSCATAGRATF